MYHISSVQLSCDFRAGFTQLLGSTRLAFTLKTLSVVLSYAHQTFVHAGCVSDLGNFTSGASKNVVPLLRWKVRATVLKFFIFGNA